MPNCDFYATPEDHRGLLEWLFLEGQCDVYELSSEPEQPLKRFQSADDVIREFDRTYPNGKKWKNVDLQIYVKGAGPPFVPRRFELNPKYCKGARFRFAADGLGLVQLYLAASANGQLENSHTNHFSERRARMEAAPQEYHRWDFPIITKFSSRLNREIKRRSVGNFGSRPILHGARELWISGTVLWPFVPNRDTPTWKS